MPSGPVHVQDTMRAADARPRQRHAVDNAKAVAKVGVAGRANWEHPIARLSIFERGKDAVASTICTVDRDEARVAADGGGVGKHMKTYLAPMVGGDGNLDVHDAARYVHLGNGCGGGGGEVCTMRCVSRNDVRPGDIAMDFPQAGAIPTGGNASTYVRPAALTSAPAMVCQTYVHEEPACTIKRTASAISVRIILSQIKRRAHRWHCDKAMGIGWHRYRCHHE